MGNKRTLSGIVIRVLLCTVAILVLVPILATLVLGIPPVQRAVVGKAQKILYQKTGIKASIGSVRVEPPFNVSLAGVLALDSRADTVLSIGRIVLQSDLNTLKDSTVNIGDFRLDNVVFDSRDLLGATSVCGRLEKAWLRSDSTSIAGRYTLIDGIKIKGAIVEFVADTLEKEKSREPFDWKIDLNAADLSDITFSMPAADISAHIDRGFLSGGADLLAMRIKADSLSLDGGSVGTAGKLWRLDHLGAEGILDGSTLDITRLEAKSGSATATLSATADLTDLQNSASYDAAITLDGFHLSEFVDTPHRCSADGSLLIKGHGIDPCSKDTEIDIKADLSNAVWDGSRIGPTALTASVSDASAKGRLGARNASWGSSEMAASGAGTIDFNIRNFNSARPAIKAGADLSDLTFTKDSLTLDLPGLSFATDIRRDGTSLGISTEGLEFTAEGKGHAVDLLAGLQKFTSALPDSVALSDIKGILKAEPFKVENISLDSLRKSFPTLSASLSVKEDNPLSGLLASKGISFRRATLNSSLSPQDGIRTSAVAEHLCKDSLSLHKATLTLVQRGDVLDCEGDFNIPAQSGLPDVNASVSGWFGPADADLHLLARSQVSDSLLSLHDISSGIALDMAATLNDGVPGTAGTVRFDDLRYGGNAFGDREVQFSLTPRTGLGYEIGVHTDDVPMALFEQYLPEGMVSLHGALAANLYAKGPLDSLTISGEALPKQAVIHYIPYKADFALSGDPLELRDMKILPNGMRIFAQDSTVARLTGSFDLRSMTSDLALDSDRLRPVPLEKDDSTSYYGTAITAVALNLKGPKDSLKVGGRIDILPETDITLALGKNNYAKAHAKGSLDVDMPLGGDLTLRGRIDLEKGELKYTVPFYPLAPFRIDEGSHLDFDGPLSAMKVDMTFSQKAKAIVSETGERARNVNFNVALQLANSLQDPQLHFLMKALDDDTIQEEIDKMTVEERDRIAAVLLATGMYTSDTNAQNSDSGYALVSILQRSVNTIAGNKLGNIVDIDLGIGGNSDYESSTTDYSMKLSKSFFNEKLKLTVGGTLSSTTMEETSGKTSAFINNVSAEYALGKEGRTAVTVFHKRDYENIVDGDIEKEGIGVRTSLDWKGRNGAGHPYRLDLQGDVSYRSNRQLGPKLGATLSKYNMFGLEETVSARLHGAYYWRVGDRSGTAAGNDNFNGGADISMTIPNLVGSLTKYKAGYQHENIAGARKLDKVSISATHRFNPGPFITHELTPFSLSLIKSEATDSFYEGITSIHELIAQFIRDEYIPAAGYRFTYDNTPDKDRKVTTMFSASVKESGNLISGAQSLFGMNFNEKEKKFIFGNYDQFLKTTVELRNNFHLPHKSSIATRLLAGVIAYYGNSSAAPMSEEFYSGGPSSIRAFAPRSIGPGGFYSDYYNLNFYHSGDIRAEANVEYRFPLFWLLEGAVFVDAGNVWNLENTLEELTEDDKMIMDFMGMPYNYDDAPLWRSFFDTTALGTGFGIRLAYQSIIVRLDTGIAIHCPYDTGISSYYNVPNFFKDGLRLNFGIGYPF